MGSALCCTSPGTPASCVRVRTRTTRPLRTCGIGSARVLAGREAILDGEIVSLDAKGKPVFRELLKGRGYLAFAASDLVWLDGSDLRSLPLVERKRRLADLLPADTGPLYKVFTLEEHGRALFEAARKMDLEGIIAKRCQDPYHQTRSGTGSATRPIGRETRGWICSSGRRGRGVRRSSRGVACLSPESP